MTKNDFLVILKVKYQNVPITLEFCHMSYITGSLLANFISNNFWTFIPEHPVPFTITRWLSRAVIRPGGGVIWGILISQWLPCIFDRYPAHGINSEFKIIQQPLMSYVVKLCWNSNQNRVCSKINQKRYWWSGWNKWHCYMVTSMSDLNSVLEFYICGCGILCCAIFGLVGNIATILLLTVRQARTNSTFTSLILWLAVIDSLFLVRQ